MRLLNIFTAVAFSLSAVLLGSLWLLIAEGSVDVPSQVLIVSLSTGFVFGSTIMLVIVRWLKRSRRLNRQPRLRGASLRSTRSQYDILFEGIRAELDFRNARDEYRDSLPTSPKIAGRRVLFVTSNGGGLGHLSRTLAVAAEWDGEVRFLTMSKGYSLIASAGYHGGYVPSQNREWNSRQQWGSIFARSLWKEITNHPPVLVLFDGVAIYPELRDITRLAGLPLVWLRRGMWKTSVRDASHQYNFPEEVCDYLIEPDDLVLADCRTTSEWQAAKIPRISVPPIVSLRPEKILRRDEAIMDLNLKSHIKYVLIQLGAGNVNEIRDAENIAAEAVKNLGLDWEPIIVRSPISKNTEKTGRPTITRYPLAAYFRAFEFGIFSGGYNTLQEVINFGLPSVTLPNTQTLTDDQEARVSIAAERGLVLGAHDRLTLSEAVVTLANPDCRDQMRKKLAQIAAPTGAYETARALENISELHERAESRSF